MDSVSSLSTGFVDLPSEILIKVLLLLPSPSALLAAAASCRTLHDLFSTAAVQYAFQLMTSHMQDWTVLDAEIPPAPVAERLAILSERQRRWRSLQWKRRQAVVATQGDGGTVYDFLGGVLALGMDSPCRTLKFYKIPSTLGSTDVPSRACTPGWVIKDFTSDPAQDLLVLIQVWSPSKDGVPVVPRRHSYRIHLLTLSSFEPHPKAKQPLLEWPYFLSSSTSPFISVMDNVVSLQASIHRTHIPEGGLCIWDWKRGVRVAVQPSTLEEVIESFSFLAKDVYVTAQINEETSDLSLNLHTFDSSFTPSSAESDFVPPPILLATHALPPSDVRPGFMQLRLDPAPGTHPGLPPFAEGAGRTPMFVPDGGERLLVLDMTFQVVDDDDGQWRPIERRYTLFILKSTLLKSLKHFPPLDALHSKAAQDRREKAAQEVKEQSLRELVGGPRPLSRASSFRSFKGMDGVEEHEEEEEEAVDEEGPEEKVEEDDGDSDWSDEEDYEGNSGVRPLEKAWIDWADYCRLLYGIPFEHSWVLYVYQSKFVHAVCCEASDPQKGGLAPDDMHISVRARILDFSPYSVARLASAGATAVAPSKCFVHRPDVLPDVFETPQGDRGRLVTLPNVVQPGDVWTTLEPLTTGRSLPYVERETAEVAKEAVIGQREFTSGFCVDEQRLVVVKRGINNDLIFDVLFF